MKSLTLNLTRNLLAGVSRAAVAVGLPPLQKRRDATVTDHCGKKGTPFRRIIRHERKGPFHFWETRFVPDKGAGAAGGGTYKRVLARIYHQDIFLHATKGFRTYTNGLPVGKAPRRYGPGSQGFLTAAGKWQWRNQQFPNGWRPATLVDDRIIPVEV